MDFLETPGLCSDCFVNCGHVLSHIFVKSSADKDSILECQKTGVYLCSFHLKELLKVIEEWRLEGNQRKIKRKKRLQEIHKKHGLMDPFEWDAQLWFKEHVKGWFPNPHDNQNNNKK